jgi:DNA-directed RNA polymerase subunit K/omega
MPLKKVSLAKPKNVNNAKIKVKASKAKTVCDKSEEDLEKVGGAPDDVIEKEDFDEMSGDENADKDENEEDVDAADEVQKEEDDDILGNRDYGDEDQKEEPNEEQDGEYEQEGEACLYKYAKKILSDSDESDDEVIFEDDAEPKKMDTVVQNEERETKPILTKYERVRILGDRAKQLSLGAKPMLLNVENMGPKEIAKLELERGVIPFIIEKPLPDGRRERWKVNELKIEN